MGWWASWGGQEGGRAAGTAQKKREHLRRAQTLKVDTEDWPQSAFTLQSAREMDQPLPFSAGSSQQAWETG